MAPTRAIRRTTASLLVGLFSACCTVAGPADNAAGQPIELVRLESHDAHDRLWPRADYVVRSEEQWLEVWAQGKGEPDPRVMRAGAGRPLVDFERFMLVGVSRGQQGHGCYGLSIEEAIEHADGIEVRFAHPGADDHLPGQPFRVCIAVVIPLIDWALLPRSAKLVRFVRVR